MNDEGETAPREERLTREARRMVLGGGGRWWWDESRRREISGIRRLIQE